MGERITAGYENQNWELESETSDIKSNEDRLQDQTRAVKLLKNKTVEITLNSAW